MASIMIKCPVSGRAVSTGIETESAVFRKLPKVSSRMHCPACGKNHVWSVSSAWLSGEPFRLRLVPGRKHEAA